MSLSKMQRRGGGVAGVAPVTLLQLAERPSAVVIGFPMQSRASAVRRTTCPGLHGRGACMMALGTLRYGGAGIMLSPRLRESLGI
jgi:hypothetical protein